MRDDLADIFTTRTGLGDQVMVDFKAQQADDGEPVLRQQVIDGVDRARGGILNG